ncbi:hypothetical protein N7468_007509 [Penicillium chermesinum]|uniref:Orotidine 5'-phosphate decarboxylase n=1 Tax=Penicillium chermesinum TaxID=63820 RepID=A0A9W9NX53_9EURO|nr:uncharacterized protein N7468_007509 [Penicillium chermesinum]KAJ5226284.1 hypothetical protein N7468_007509 [Penicillium chermesinum]KAJ6160534.1 hypothetical protein N7470_003930 [Penicillium chermesinum]
MPLDGASKNPILDYIQKLPETKKSLPFGVPTCVMASHLITTSAALVQLAADLGPYIAVLAVQAEIIDDWTQETTDELTFYAKKHGFILWEASRVLNSTLNLMGRLAAHHDSLATLADIIKRNYTNGAIRNAQWAGLASAWAPGVPVDHQEKDLLIPTLRRAAREAVATTVKTIQTEISADLSESSHEEEEELQLSPQVSTGWSEFSQENMGSALRKSSTISVTTETITMQPHVQPDEGIAPAPLLSRGIAICLPCDKESAFTSEYRKASIAAACANPDFVIGFLSAEPYFAQDRPRNLRELIIGDDVDDAQHKEGQEVFSTTPHFLELERPIALFSFVPYEIAYAYDMEVNQAPKEDPPDDARPASVKKLFTVMERVMAVREENRKKQAAPNDASKLPGPSIFHIPVNLIP